MKKLLPLFVVASCALLTACPNDADVASRNLSQDADNFKVARRIVFYNGITNEYILEIKGYCSLGNADPKKELSVTCKTSDGYKKHFLGLSNNVTYFAEQIDPVDVSVERYKVTFKPSVIVPSIEAR